MAKSIIPEKPAKRKEIASYGASGMKVRVLDQKEKWVQVEYADKKQGWVFSEALGMLPWGHGESSARPPGA